MNGAWRKWIGIVALTLSAGRGIAQEAKLVKLPSGPSSPEIVLDNSYLGYNPGLCVDNTQHRSSGLSAGGSFLLLKPYFGSNNTAYSTRTGITTPSPQQTNTDFVWQFEPAMAFWLGWHNENGIGFRGRYFRFDQLSHTLNANLDPAQGATQAILPPPSLANLAGSGATFGSPGLILANGLGQDLLTFWSTLKIDAVDIEATCDITRCRWVLQLAGGARYLHMSQDYVGKLSNSLPGGLATESQTLNFGHNFTGAGPTAAVQGTYNIGTTGLSLYGNVRGSLLVGNERQTAAFTQVIVDPTLVVGGNQTLSPQTSSRRETVMPIAEIEVGMGYAANLGRMQPFFRASALNQTYFNAGNASATGGNLSLFGVQFSVGVNY
jgi:hypothetical protein